MDDIATRLRTNLVEELRGRGVLRSERWTRAFRTVPRHLFLPQLYVLGDDGATYTRVTDADGNDWLRMVYTDQPWVTQLDAGAGIDRGTPTSSSSAPGLMAQMLEALTVSPLSRVLELGTGTGYNAALLCAGLTDAQVTSVDIDRSLVGRARATLARLGYRPAVDARDGDAATLPGDRRYDRLIVTYGVPHVPAQWLDLVEPGGVIVTPIHREEAIGALVRLTVEGPKRASGHFLPFYGAFMPTRRRDAGPAMSAVLAAAAREDGTARASVLPQMSAARPAEPWQFYTALVLGDVRHVDVLPAGAEDPSKVQHWVTAPDGSWACQQTIDGEVIVREGGARRLWSELERAYRRWHELGRPDRERFGLTVTPAGEELWLDEPTKVITSI